MVWVICEVCNKKYWDEKIDTNFNLCSICLIKVEKIIENMREERV